MKLLRVNCFHGIRINSCLSSLVNRDAKPANLLRNQLVARISKALWDWNDQATSIFASGARLKELADFGFDHILAM